MGTSQSLLSYITERVIPGSSITSKIQIGGSSMLEIVMVKLESGYSSLNYEISVWKKENNYKIGGTLIEKYTKFSMQLSYTKRSICDPKDY